MLCSKSWELCRRLGFGELAIVLISLRIERFSILFFIIIVIVIVISIYFHSPPASFFHFAFCRAKKLRAAHFPEKRGCNWVALFKHFIIITLSQSKICEETREGVWSGVDCPRERRWRRFAVRQMVTKDKKPIVLLTLAKIFHFVVIIYPIYCFHFLWARIIASYCIACDKTITTMLDRVK